MLQFGHLRELKEWKGLVPFLTQVAMQVHGLVHLIQPDGTVVYKFIPSEGNYLAACLNKDWQVEIVARWRSSHSPNQPQETTCFCGKPLLIIPIVWRNRIDGILTACSFIEEDHHYLCCWNYRRLCLSCSLSCTRLGKVVYYVRCPL